MTKSNFNKRAEAIGKQVVTHEVTNDELALIRRAMEYYKKSPWCNENHEDNKEVFSFYTEEFVSIVDNYLSKDFKRMINEGASKEASKTLGNAYDVKNLRQIRATYQCKSNGNGVVKIYEPKRSESEKNHIKRFDLEGSDVYGCDAVREQAYHILVRNGFNVVSRAEDNESYIFMCDNWSENFIRVEDLK